ncbi:asparaginyl-tRNA synthetase-like protein [Xylariales sp. PMI_506]|nr:asparaginyl-tRNA synthetase-like protein [Xylariales sp. PMI_506]
MSQLFATLRRPGAQLLRHTPWTASRAFISSVPNSIAGLLQWKPDGSISDVDVKGYVRSVRAQKKHHFVSLSDGTTVNSLQAVVPADLAEGLTNGAAVQLFGSWVPSRGQGQSHELQVQRLSVLGPSDAKTFPLQKKYQTPEYLRTKPHIRPRVPFNSLLLRFRSDVIMSLTQFFNSRNFVQTHTPVLTASDCEGAGEVFSVTTSNETPKADDEDTKSFFRRPVYTTVSAQLHLEALAQAVGNVWTLSPTFRAEQSDTPRHLSEFYMLEAEMTFTQSQNTVMDLVEDMIRHVATSLAGTTTVAELYTRTSEGQADLAPVEQVERRWKGLVQESWPRITYTEAIDILRSAGEPFEVEPRWGDDLRTEHERFLAQTIGKGNTPIFVTNYPRNIKAFYMKANGDGSEGRGETVECFDLLVPDFCEIAGGSTREHRLEVLLESMELHGMDTSKMVGDADNLSNNLDWYLDLRRWGCPPHGGFGLGFDRLICYLSGVQTIRDTAAFPRWYGRCDC